MKALHLLLVLLVLAGLALLAPPAMAAPQPEGPPPTIYGFVYIDGEPAPAGVRVYANTSCGVYSTSTGAGTRYENAYILQVDVPGENEDCDAALYVVVSNTSIRVWSGHLAAFDLLEVNITVSSPEPPQQANASASVEPGSGDDIVRLAATLPAPYTPSSSGGGEQPRHRLDPLSLGVGALAGLLLALALARGGGR